jgi:phosphoglycolate phosphatase-like HAD superfamily hydrolase
MVRLVLFDIDGTLIHSGGAGERAFERVCATVFRVPEATRRLYFAGRTDPSIVRDFFQQNQIPPSEENFHRFFESYVFWLDHMLNQFNGRVLPGVWEMIRFLRAASPPPVIGLLTGNIRLGAQIKLRHYQLWEHFQTGGFGDDHEDRNELAIIARERAGRLMQADLAGDQIVVIGDTPRDIECARAIQARMLAVATGHYSVEQLQKLQPTWAVRTLEGFGVNEMLA